MKKEYESLKFAAQEGEDLTKINADIDFAVRKRTAAGLICVRLASLQQWSECASVSHLSLPFRFHCIVFVLFLDREGHYRRRDLEGRDPEGSRAAGPRHRGEAHRSRLVC